MPKLIGLNDLVQEEINKYDNFYVELEPRIKSELLTTSIDILHTHSIRSLSNILKFPETRLYDINTRGTFSLHLLKKLSDFLTKNGFDKFSLDNLGQHVMYICGRGNSNKIYKPRFPFNFETEEGVRIISRMYHDGGIRNLGEPIMEVKI